MTYQQQTSLFTANPSGNAPDAESPGKFATSKRMGRLDCDSELSENLLQFCRLKKGEIWEDSVIGHRVGVLDAACSGDVVRLMGSEKAALVINDPPYNIIVGNKNSSNLSKVDLDSYLKFTRAWVDNAISSMKENAHFYCWIGADYRDNFQPLPDFMILMREFSEIQPKNFITLRNQRGYGTQKNWMWVRQELLHYVRGNPAFTVVYTDIPKILKGYYKNVNGKLTENMERSKSNTIRPGNVWVDVQQVFYRMEENVPGCYAQKPLKAIERIIESSSSAGDLVLDMFSHSGTTLLAGERLDRKVYTCDINPVFAEMAIRRLERFRTIGKTGWQWRNPFSEMAFKDGN